MKTYLKNLEAELNKLRIRPNDIKEIMDDFKEMLEEAQNDGVSDDDLESKFGNPNKLASELYQDSLESKIGENVESVVLDDVLNGYELLKSFSVVNGLNEVLIKLVSEDIIYFPSDQETIEVFVKNLKNENDYTIEMRNEAFVLERKPLKSLVLFGITKSPSFAIRVPNNLLVKLFNTKVVSGNVTCNQVNAKELEISTTSGDLQLSNIKVDSQLKLTSVSADMKCTGITAEKLVVSQVSGDCEFETTNIVRELSFNTVSGNVTLTDVTGEHIEYRAVSGDLSGTEVYVKTASVRTVSGDFEITNSKDGEKITVLSKKSVSGDVTFN